MDTGTLKNEAEWEKLGQRCPLWAALTTPGKEWTDEEFLESGKQEIDEVIKLLSDKGIDFNKEKAMDFGCGPGRLSNGLFQYFEHVTGVDASVSMIDYAKSLVKDVEFVQTTSLDVFDNGAFDFIYSNYVLQHISPKNTLGYLKEFGRVLRPGGLAVFCMPIGRTKSFKNFLRGFLPNSKLIYRLRFGNLPVMEMHGMKSDTVIEATELHEVLVLPSNDRSERWQNCLYVLSK